MKKHTQYLTVYLAVVREYKVGSFYENCFYNISEAIDFASEIADCINQCGRGDDNPELYEDVNMSIYKLIFESELDIPSPWYYIEERDFRERHFISKRRSENLENEGLPTWEEEYYKAMY